MPEIKIPPEVYRLRPSRRLIMMEYFRVRSYNEVSIIRVVSHNLGYTICNGKNSFVEKVIREFLKQNTIVGR